MIARWGLVGLALMASGGSAMAAVGELSFAHGEVSVVASDGARRAATRGQQLQEGDEVVVASGWAQLRMADGTRLALQPGSRLKLRDYGGSGRSAALELLQGALRAVTGALTKVGGAGMRLETPTATVGIRGTEFLARAENGTTVAVSSGVVDLCTHAGCLTLFGGESGYAESLDARPRLLETRPVIAPPPEAPTKDVRPAESTDARGNPLIAEFVDVGEFAAFAYDDGFGGDFGLALPILGASGRPETLFDLLGPAYGQGSARLADSGFDGVIGFGRWTEGTALADFGSGTVELPLSANQGLHYVFGKPTLPMPVTGLATYTLLGATQATSDDGSLGLGRISGGLSVDFFMARVGVDLSITFPDAGYHVRSSGGVENPSLSEIDLIFGPFFFNEAFFVPTTGTAGGACGGVGRDDCLTDVIGFFAGQQAIRAGLTVDILDLGLDNSIHAAATFSRGSFDPLPSDILAFSSDDRQIGMFLAQGAAQLDPSGAARRFDGLSGGFLARGTAIAADFGYDGVVGFGRWSGGELQADFGAGVFDIPIGVNQGLHYAFGTPTPTMPVVATGEYTLSGATRATSSDGSLGLGSFAGSMAVDFLSLAVGVDFTVNFPSVSYHVRTTGGVADTSNSELEISGATFLNPDFFIPTTGTGGACASVGCVADVSGFFAGTGARRAGFGYEIQDRDLATAVHGAAVFAQTRLDPILGFVGAFAVDERDVGGFAWDDEGSVHLRGDAATAFIGTFITARALDATVTADGYDGTIGWGRWTGGSITLDAGFGPVEFTPGAGEAFHYAFGTPTPTMPTSGVGRYDQIGATIATSDGGVLGNGSFSGGLAVDFGSGRVGTEFDVAFAGAGYRVATTGGIADPSQSEMTLLGPGSNRFRASGVPAAGTGSACASGCSADLGGFFAGTGAARAGMSYHIGDPGLATAVHGVAAFTKR